MPSTYLTSSRFKTTVRYFNLLTAFCYNERVVKSDFFYVLNMFWATILIIKYHAFNYVILKGIRLYIPGNFLLSNFLIESEGKCKFQVWTDATREGETFFSIVEILNVPIIYRAEMFLSKFNTLIARFFVPQSRRWGQSPHPSPLEFTALCVGTWARACTSWCWPAGWRTRVSGQTLPPSGRTSRNPTNRWHRIPNN